MGWIGLVSPAGVAMLLPRLPHDHGLTSHGRPWAVASWTRVLSTGSNFEERWGSVPCLRSLCWWPPPPSTGGARCSTGGEAAPMARPGEISSSNPGQNGWNDYQATVFYKRQPSCFLSEKNQTRATSTAITSCPIKDERMLLWNYIFQRRIIIVSSQAARSREREKISREICVVWLPSKSFSSSAELWI